jgi:preprotein translocase subunit SecD
VAALIFFCITPMLSKAARVASKAMLPFHIIGKRIVRTLGFLGRVVRPLLLPRGRTRVRLVLFVVLVLVVAASQLDYPRYWDASADWVNPKLDAVNVPAVITRYDQWGVFRTLDEKLYVKHFWDIPFSLGLDLQGGVHLVYQADLSQILSPDQDEAMAALRDTIERRVNFLGVQEPVVQVQKGAAGQRLIVELAGVDDPNEAIRQIGQTPFLEFKQPLNPEEQYSRVSSFLGDQATEEQARQFCLVPFVPNISVFLQASGGIDPCFDSTELTGKFLDRADVTTNPQTSEVEISLQFDDEGAKLFETLTSENVGSYVAIYLDEQPVSIPTVNSAISGGRAVITGSFTVDEARELVRNLNSGALPVPITLISQQRVGATLGAVSLQDSLTAALVGLVAVFAFLIAVYRFSGVLAGMSLAVYIIFLLALIKLIPVTLTLAGIAGLILSVGMAVDANVLVFERLREELAGERKNITRAIDNAFSRAWPSIRDGNISTLLTAAILFWFSTSFVQGFALTLGLGIITSVFSSMVVTKYLLKLIAVGRFGRAKALWSRM